MSKVTVAVGDIHGCLEEFDELLKTIQYNPNQMRLVLLGDLMDRGPDPVGCVRRARELDVECIMGNHEEKHLRWHKHQKKFDETGKSNPMKPMAADDAKANSFLSDQDWTWMKALPLKLDLGLGWWAVHAGCEPKYTLHKQNPSQIMRVRYVDERGTGKSLNADLSQPEGTVYWDQQWKGPESLVYGHCVHDLKEWRHTTNNGVQCVGIDTGCCFGGHLTAMLMERSNSDLVPAYEVWSSLNFVQVKAKKVYSVRGKDGQ